MSKVAGQPHPLNEIGSDLVDTSSKPADFETAIKACGFGAFNVYLLLVSLLGIIARMFESANMAYVLPAAECDLKLTLMDKGLVSAVSYAGMIIFAIPWGYIADTRGRKQVLVWGLLLSSLMTLCCAFSWNYPQILVFKFLGGAISCGPFAVLMSYLSELHCKSHRSRVIMITGMMRSSGSLLLPALAIGILPLDWPMRLFGIQFYIWQMFLAITALPSLISGLLIALYFPESPQFLMCQGRHSEALRSLQYIFSVNHRKPPESYPISSLLGDGDVEHTMTSQKITFKESLQQGFHQMAPLFRKPYLKVSLLVYAVSFCILMGHNTLRFWMPQLFATMTEYRDKGFGDAGICEILEYNVNRTVLLKASIERDSELSCDAHITTSSYTNNVIVALTSLAGTFTVSLVVNKLGNRNILKIGTILSFSFGIGLYWSSSSLMTVALAALFLACNNINSTAVTSTSVNIFPTSMRTMVVVMTNTFGRFGSLSGNILFPLFITFGCVPPFLFIGGVTFTTVMLTFLLPGSTKTL